MEAGTSPSIAVKYNGHYVIAYHGADGNLHVWDRLTGAISTGIAMTAGTSPAITALNHEFGTSSWVVAINRGGGELAFYYETGAVTHTGYGELPGTSPGAASVAIGTGRFEAPFQANTGILWLYMPGGVVASTGYGMAAGSGPSVIGFSEGSPTAPPPQYPYEIAFQTNASQMWNYEPEGLLTNTPYGMAANTSPSIGPG